MPKKKETVQTESGNISIHTENILPIIKKWLYSDHEIFLRELVSNAVDATTKLKHLAAAGEYKKDVSKAKIVVELDKDKKEIRVKDSGIGMSADEIKKYINQIAFSGAEEFVAKYKKDDENSGIIGHFGLGFYSAFMVSEKVEIHTKSYQTDAPAAHWVSDGSDTFTIDASDKKEVGTDVILHIDSENEDFLEKERIREILNKYCKFLPVPVEFDGETINEVNPVWVQAPADVKDKEYKDFYQKLYPFQPEPLFWIHLNVDYPFRLTGILYFPKIQHELDVNKGQIQLYCQQVYVSNDVSDVLPEFLTLLRGVIDSPDIPLNVSRSFLQNDRNVKKISSHIAKKVADKLRELAENKREDFQKYWKDIAPFVKFGMITDDSFFERAYDVTLSETTDKNFTTIEEYVERNKEKNKSKDNKTIVLYTNDKNKQSAYIHMAREKELEILILDHMIDNHFITTVERHKSNLKFTRVDSNVIDKLINPDAITVEVDKQQSEVLEKVFKQVIDNEKMKISVENLSSSDVAAKIIVSEESRRLKEMMRNMTVAAQGDQSIDDMFDESTLVVNYNNDLTRKIILMEPTKGELVKDMAAHIFDMALMAQKPLDGERMHRFTKRMYNLMGLIN